VPIAATIALEMIGPIPGTLTLYSLYYNETRTHPGVGQGRAATTIRPTIWDHIRYTALVRIASSLRADMIFGKDTFA
jgi:hypothetical protein